MRKRDLEKLLRHWQKRLYLQDWEIDVEVVPRSKMPDQVGELEYVLEFRDATIKVRSDVDDPEQVIVHELLHCWTRQIRAARSADLIEEQALEAIGSALLPAK